MNQHRIRSNRSRAAMVLGAVLAVALTVQAGPAGASAGPGDTTTKVVTYSQPMSTIDLEPVVGYFAPQQHRTVLLQSAFYNPSVSARVRWTCSGWPYQDVTVTVPSNGAASVPWPASFGALPPSGCILHVIVPPSIGTPAFLLFTQTNPTVNLIGVAF